MSKSIARTMGPLFLLAGLFLGCSQPAAISLLGEPLPMMQPSSEQSSQLRRNLVEAEQRLHADPDHPDHWIWVGRRQAYLGRYQDAIETFTAAIERFPEDFRIYRHRGHRYLTLRQLVAAEQDLQRAAELARGVTDAIEPDGAPNAFGIPRSTTHSNIYYHLGLVKYLQRDFHAARSAWQKCMEFAEVNDDMLCATLYWRVLTAWHLGEDPQPILSRVHSEMEILENHAYFDLLMVFRGDKSAPSVLAKAAEGSLDAATRRFGIAMLAWSKADRGFALDEWKSISQHPVWPAFAVIAAEAELAAEN